MKIWIASDTHFGHEKMVEFCGRPKDFGPKIFKALAQIPSDDMLIHLGDVCMGKDEASHAMWIQPLSCKKMLVMGNHDRKSISWYLEHGWDSVVHSAVIEAFGKRILLSHVPYDSKVVKHVAEVNVHGHFHDKTFRLKQFAKMYEYDPLVHSCMAMEKTEYRPVTLRHIIENPVKYRAVTEN